MKLEDVRFLFNRAISLTFIWKKFLLTFFTLVACGSLMVFFRGLSLYTGNWMSMSLTFLPIFFGMTVLLSLGVILIRVYHDEVKQKSFNYRRVIVNSWDILIGSSYFSVPLLLCYLILWILLGVFVLLSEIPTIGPFFISVLAFGPFLLNFGTVALILLGLAMLFLVTPPLALRGLDRKYVSRVVIQRIVSDLFSNIFLAFVAIFPFLFLASMLWFTFSLTDAVLVTPIEPQTRILYWFFMMIPFTAIITPAVILFFNIAVESHVLILRLQEKITG